MNKLRRLKISALLALALACSQMNIFGAFDENSLQNTPEHRNQQTYINELRRATEEARIATEDARRATQEARNALTDIRNSVHDAHHNINTAKREAIAAIIRISAMGQ